MEKKCILEKIKQHPIETGTIITTAIIFTTLGATLGPYKTSILIITLIILYILLQGTKTTIKLIPLTAAIATHIGALTTYYSHPQILPLIIIEKTTQGKYTINIDIVQITTLYEIRQTLKNPPKCKTENTKTPQQTPINTKQAAVV